ncbi:MAG: RES family NAD+ phosphorylase [Caulobacteraceae bacterium]
MNPRNLPEPRAAYRIGDPAGAYPIFDATGSTLYPGRWNDPSHPLIYASERFSTALLEKLVRGSGRLPPNQYYVEITIPAGATYEVFQPASHPGWDLANGAVSKAFGCGWQASRRSLILIVPSVIARLDSNIIINHQHPEFGDVKVSLETPVYWDARLFP